MVAEKLVAIIGPTASGKSGLAVDLARKFDGEIICADSRTIYKGMNVGTAKPTAADRAAVPHHLLDILEPNQSFSVAEFKERANTAIADVRRRGRLPILVGGSGLYINAVVYDYQFPAGPANKLREELQGLSLPALVERLQTLDPDAATTIDLNNPRRVIRAIETAGLPRQKRPELMPAMMLVGLNPNLEMLEKKIVQRTQMMLDAGLVEEVRGLVQKYGADCEPFNSVGYRETIEFINGAIKEAELAGLISLHTRQLAKRQLTWWRRDPNIVWAQGII